MKFIQFFNDGQQWDLDKVVSWWALDITPTADKTIRRIRLTFPSGHTIDVDGKPAADIERYLKQFTVTTDLL